jgi:hypothetical protein
MMCLYLIGPSKEIVQIACQKVKMCNSGQYEFSFVILQF